MRMLKAGLAALTVLACCSFAPDAAALLLDNQLDDPATDLVFFYPYPTAYRHVDPGYAFDDDPLTAFVHDPYILPIVLHRIPVRQVLVQPRMTFVPEMYRSTEIL